MVKILMTAFMVVSGTYVVVTIIRSVVRDIN